MSFIFPLLISTFSGAAILHYYFFDELGFIIKLISGFFLGLSITTIWMMILSLFSVPWSIFSISIIPFLLGAIFLFLSFRFRQNKDLPCPESEIESVKETYSLLSRIAYSILAILIFLKIAFVFYMVSTRPTFADDAIWNWNLKAKMFHTEQSLILDQTDPNYLGNTVMDYPLNSVFTRVWMNILNDEFSEPIANSINAITYLLLILFLYFSIQEKTNNKMALFAVYIFSAAPLFVYHAFNGYADILLSAYFLCAVYFWHRGAGESRNLIFSSLFLASAIWTKTEGLFLTFILFIPFIWQELSMRKDKIFKSLLYFLLAPVTVYLLWALFKSQYLSSSTETSTLSQITGSFGWHPEVIAKYFELYFITPNFLFLWIFIATITIIFWKRIFKDEIKYFSLLIWLMLITYLPIYIFTDFYSTLFSHLGVIRYTIHFVPVMTVFIALSIHHFLLKNHD